MNIFMETLKQLIHGNHHPLINRNPWILSKRPQFRLLYQELSFIIQTLSNIHENHELEKLRDILIDAVEEAQYIIDRFVSDLHINNSLDSGISKLYMETTRYIQESLRLNIINTTNINEFSFSREFENAIRAIECIKVELMTKMNTFDLSPRMDRLKPTSSLQTKTPLEESFHRDVVIIRDKLVEDTKQLAIVSIVGKGGLGKTTLATKVFTDRFIVYHFPIRGWVTVSQTCQNRDLLIQILMSISFYENLEEDTDAQLGEKLHKELMGKRYLIVIDDIWSVEAWDELKLFLPHDNNTGSRILLTSRFNEVALRIKPDGFIHMLPYLTEEESWELLRKKVFDVNECPEELIKPGMQIAKKCQGLPLSVVVIAGVLAKEVTNKDLWEKIACSMDSYIVSDQLETLSLSYDHLPSYLRECFLYLGGFPEDFVINIRELIWLIVAEGFIEEVGNQSLEDTAKAYLMDLIDRNLLIVAERNFTGDVKACKLHDLVRELCLRKAKEEKFYFKINQPLSSYQPLEVIAPYKQCRVFTNQDVNNVDYAHLSTNTLRSLLCFHEKRRIKTIANDLYSLAFIRVLNLQNCEVRDFPKQMSSLCHLRYLALWSSSDFPSSICKLWNLQTLIVKTSRQVMVLPGNMSDLVNLRHLWCNNDLLLPFIGKPMNLKTISKVEMEPWVDDLSKWFPCIKKLGLICHTGKNYHFELLPYLETLKLRGGFNKYCIRFPSSLKKLKLFNCHLSWSDMSIIHLLPNLEILTLKHYAFAGTEWNVGEHQFLQLRILKIDFLNFKHWKAYSTSFPCLKRLALHGCTKLEEIPHEIGEITTLELIETDSWSQSVVKSLKRMQENTELKIVVDGMELSSYLAKLED